jgi:hypothetical protein
MRVFTHVRIWKGGTRRATVCLYRMRGADGTTTTWYVVTNLAGAHTRFVEYACRWWHECTHKLLKSGFFNWEDGRVRRPARVMVLLMGFGCACWALWLLGRTHEQTSRRKPSTTKSQPRRRSVVKWGWEVLRAACKRRKPLEVPPPSAPRVLDYRRPACSTTSAAFRAIGCPVTPPGSRYGNENTCVLRTKDDAHTERTRRLVLFYI